jgi:hypothetical protein
MPMNETEVRGSTGEMPEPYVTVIALHEGTWVLATWTGEKWISQGRAITATRWLPCVTPHEGDASQAA